MSESIVRGTVVLVPFPFTDLSSEKLRPAVVISSPRLGGVDVCVVFITSRIATSVPPDGLLIDDTHPDFSKTGLKTASLIRAGKIATLDRRVVLGALGRLTPALLRALNQKLKFALGL